MVLPETEIAPFSVEPLSPSIGAVIAGADLSRPDPALCAALKQALLEWKVLFFYDNDISAAERSEERRVGKECW